MSKHTQFNWYRHRGTEFVGSEIKEYYYVSNRVIDADDEMIVAHKIRNASDARLIESAPDLLRAAKQALAVLNARRPSDAVSYEKAQEWLADAIAKAEREE